MQNGKCFYLFITCFFCMHQGVHGKPAHYDDEMPEDKNIGEYFFSHGLRGKAPRYYSQMKQDKYVHEHFFKDFSNGFFVDIGAHDGISYSNTYFFEKYLGWTGICVEPLPNVFEKLRKNRACICVNACICDVAGTGKFLEIRGAPEMLSGLIAKYDARHYDRVRSELRQGGSSRVIDVPCITFNDLMEKYNITHIDYLSVDTEGGEFDIIASIDLKNIDIDIIDVEVNFEDQTNIREYLTQNGYRFVTRLKIDEIYEKIR